MKPLLLLLLCAFSLAATVPFAGSASVGRTCGTPAGVDKELLPENSDIPVLPDESGVPSRDALQTVGVVRLPARLEVPDKSAMALAILVNAADAIYPIRVGGNSQLNAAMYNIHTMTTIRHFLWGILLWWYGAESKFS